MDVSKFYVQEHEVFGAGDRVIWTSEPMTQEEATELKKKLDRNVETDTWYSIGQDWSNQ